jgi:hypothetical protein
MQWSITGHTSGLGKYLYEYFSSKVPINGLSRSNGFDILTDQNKIMAKVSHSDVFINCTHHGDCQKQLLLSLVNKVKNIIVIGTSMQMFDDFLSLSYIQEKRNLSECCRLLSVDPSIKTNILLINISFLPRTESSLMDTDNNIEYQDVADIIDYWMTHKNISEISFSWKMTELVRSEFEQSFPNLNFDILKDFNND